MGTRSHLTTGLRGEGSLLLSCLYLAGQSQATRDTVALPPRVNLRSFLALMSYMCLWAVEVGVSVHMAGCACVRVGRMVVEWFSG